MLIETRVRTIKISKGVLCAFAALHPFAEVDSVSPESPAEKAGIRLGDQLCSFGSVTAADIEDISAAMLQLSSALQV